MEPNSQTSAPTCTMSHPLNKDVNEDIDPQGEQDQTSCLAQTHHHHQDRHLNADSKHRRHPLRQGETESLHRNEQNTETEIG